MFICWLPHYGFVQIRSLPSGRIADTPLEAVNQLFVNTLVAFCEYQLCVGLWFRCDRAARRTTGSNSVIVLRLLAALSLLFLWVRLRKFSKSAATHPYCIDYYFQLGFKRFHLPTISDKVFYSACGGRRCLCFSSIVAVSLGGLTWLPLECLPRCFRRSNCLSCLLVIARFTSEVSLCRSAVLSICFDSSIIMH